VVGGLQHPGLMRAITAALAVPLLLLLPFAAAAQERLAPHPAHAATFTAPPAGPVVAVAPVSIGDPDDDAAVVMQRTTEHVAERLRPLEQRLREDDRLRRAGAILVIGAVAIGALHGTAPLTFAGTQAVRFGLQAPLDAIERRTGFAIEPSIGHRRIAVTVNRTFR